MGAWNRFGLQDSVNN